MGASAGLTRSVQPTTNTTPATGGMPAQGKGSVTPRPPVLPPPGQSSGVPPQGGKGGVPAQGGKGGVQQPGQPPINFGPNVFPARPPIGAPIPPQGGKSVDPQMAPYVDAMRPQVQQPQVQPGLMTQNQMLTSPGQVPADIYKAYVTAAMNNPQQPQVMPPRAPIGAQPPGMPKRPGQMPANRAQPQVMPAQGLMGLQNMLYGIR